MNRAGGSSYKNTKENKWLASKKWLKAICPFCGKEYQYLPDYKPATCGKFDCLQKQLSIFKNKGQ